MLNYHNTDTSEQAVRTYFDYIFLSDKPDDKDHFKKGQEAVFRVSNFGEMVVKVLCDEPSLYKTKLEAFAQDGMGIAADPFLHARVKRLREVLECLLESEKIELLTTLGETYANYLRLAILRSQAVTYQNEQSGVSGIFRVAGRAIGVSHSQVKANFLKQLADHFSGQHTELPEPNDAEWQSLLCNIMLPGVDTLKTLLWLPADYLNKIGVARAVVRIKSDAARMQDGAFQQLMAALISNPQPASQAQETALNVELQFDNQYFIRIKRKTDGKNKGAYDGTYVLREIYDAQEEENKNKLNAYQKEQVFFLKMFPSGKKVVEGFAEAFVGSLIQKLFEGGFIELSYRDCFAPARIVDLPDNAGPALMQPFVLGSQLLYQCGNADLEAKPFLSELGGMLSGSGYERYLESLSHQKHAGLSFILMLMILVGNYSVHSGNILVTPGAQVNQYTAIDYGAALRNFMGTEEQQDIWKPLEVQLGLLDGSGNGALRVDKKYVEHYKTIPGLLESTVEHAKKLQEKLKDRASLTQFQVALIHVTQAVYECYKQVVIKQYNVQYWNTTAKEELFRYIYGTAARCQNIQKLSIGQEENEGALLGWDICQVIIQRISKMASYKEPTSEPSRPNASRYASVVLTPGVMYPVLNGGAASSSNGSDNDDVSLAPGARLKNNE